MSEHQKIIEYQKLIEQNQVFADYIKRHNLTDDEIKELKLKELNHTFEYGEGSTINNSVPSVFFTWKEANDFIYRRSLRDGYYFKQYFTVEYEDGKKYSGRYDVFSIKSDKRERADIGAHIMSHNLFYSERQQPSYMNEESIKGILAGTKREDKKACAEFLDHYEIKVKNQSNIFYC